MGDVSTERIKVSNEIKKLLLGYTIVGGIIYESTRQGEFEHKLACSS